MNEVVKFLSENSVLYFATIGLDGKPKNRPFGFMTEYEGKLWFCTNNKKDVFEQLKKNPYLEVSATSPNFSWIRLSGKAIFENNIAVKEICFKNDSIKALYQTPENPIFEVFYLAECKAVIADFSGNPPTEYVL